MVSALFFIFKVPKKSVFKAYFGFFDPETSVLVNHCSAPKLINVTSLQLYTANKNRVLGLEKGIIAPIQATNLKPFHTIFVTSRCSPHLRSGFFVKGWDLTPMSSTSRGPTPFKPIEPLSWQTSVAAVPNRQGLPTRDRRGSPVRLLKVFSSVREF